MAQHQDDQTPLTTADLAGSSTAGDAAPPGPDPTPAGSPTPGTAPSEQDYGAGTGDGSTQPAGSVDLPGPRDRQDETGATPQPAGEEPGTAGATDAPAQNRAEVVIALLEPGQAVALQERWTEVQGRFVDDPRGAVRDADALVAELMQLLAAGFAEHKAGLEEQWSRDDEPDTERLRQALQRYRSFFSRLLAT
jgi:hypothetical protein